uniref:Integrase, catalytic region, zinc finger, CCHC-type, peptidase aspartic, catalytic n=1 Tax=Tanacetum cinerariifolium TaxID=118510 RepID=A0A699ITK8_TANCI|nr:integrase, catalytic region, zinc finger, CCHC-type, peptidase aspartic, catalytic [Tanacetum cinerariifolium]
MMKSFPICLLSKAFKNKSWLWHRRLNHLNFGTINDLAREDLVRGLLRLKFKKDHLCSACQLEAVDTACYTQNRSLIHTRRNKTPYELVHAKKLDLTFFVSLVHFVTLPMTAKILENYNQQLILEFSFVMHQAGRVIESTTNEPDESWKLFTPISFALAVLIPVNSAGTPSSTTIDQDAPSPSHSPSSSAFQSLSLLQGVAAKSTIMEDNPFAPVDNNPFVNAFDPEPCSEASSSGDVHSAHAVQAPVNSTGTPSSTTIDQDAPSPSTLPSSSAL